jgi:hypothetical protein
MWFYEQTPEAGAGMLRVLLPDGGSKAMSDTMKFRNQTRRKYLFDVTGVPDFELDGIKCAGGKLEFPRVHADNAGKKTFELQEDCVEWFEGFEKQRNEKHEKAFLEITAKSVEVSEQEWEAVKRQMVNPEAFQKENVRVYHPYLANNFRDRDGQRFPVKTLYAFAKSIIGKSILPEGHNWGPPGNGRIFAADVKKHSVDESLSMLGGQSWVAKEHLLEVEKRDGGVYWLVPAFYTLASEKEFVEKLDAGIIKDMSIGFRAFLNPVKDNDGNLLWEEWTGQGGFEPEAVEASFVFLGAQLGAQNRKSASPDGEILTAEDAIKPYEKDNKSEIQALRYPKSVWDVDDARKHCAGRGGSFEAASDKSAESVTEPETNGKESPSNNDKGVVMKVEVKSLGLEKELELTEDAVKAFVAEVESQVDELIETGDAANDEIEALKKQVSDLEAKAALGDEYKAEVIKEALKYGILAGLFKEDKTEAKTKLFSKLDVGDIKAMRDEFFNAYTEKNPPPGKLKENTQDLVDDNKGGKKEVRSAPKTAFQSEV